MRGGSSEVAWHPTQSPSLLAASAAATFVADGTMYKVTSLDGRLHHRQLLLLPLTSLLLTQACAWALLPYSSITDGVAAVAGGGGPPPGAAADRFEV